MSVNIGSTAQEILNEINNKINKTTYEASAELACSSNGKVCLGKFGAYDTNITIELNSTTSKTYHATIVIWSQNVKPNATKGSVGCNVYGDADNNITPLISVFRPYGSASRQIEVYADLPGWSKNLVHIQGVAISDGGMTDVLTSVSSIPTAIDGKIKVTPINVLKSMFATKDVATTSTAGLLSAADKVKLDNIKALASITEDSNGNVTVANDLTVNGVGHFGNDIEVAGTVKTNAIEATDYITLKSGYPIRFFSENNSKSVDLWCNDNGALTSSSGGDLATVGDISSGVANALKYINTHPENGGSIIPFIHNDLAFLSKKGGSYSVYSTTDTDFTVALLLQTSLGLSAPDNMFDGSPSYAMITTTGAITVVIDMTLHKMFTYSNQFYIDFGSAGWRAKGIAVYAMNKDTERKYTLKGSTTTNAKGNWYCDVSHSSKNSSGTTVQGFNKLRVVLTNFNNTSATSGKRIAQVGLLNYGSAGVTETFVSRGGSTMYGDLNTKNLYPTATNSSNLGSSSKQYNTIYGKTIYENGTTLSEKYAGKSAATQSAAGLLSAADKKKLDGIAEGANNYSYTLPAAGSSLGGVKSGGDVSITDGVITVNDNSHNHNYAGADSAGGAANYTKLIQTYYHNSNNAPQNTYGNQYLAFMQWNAKGNVGVWKVQNYKTAVNLLASQNGDVLSVGSATQPVYFLDGAPVATTYTLGKSVPADAKFTDTTYSSATQSAAGLMSAADKKKLDSTVGANELKGIYATAGNRSIWDVDAAAGITFQEKGTLFKDENASSEITDALFVQRVPIAAGNNVTFTQDTTNQLVKINASVPTFRLDGTTLYITT